MMDAVGLALRFVCFGLWLFDPACAVAVLAGFPPSTLNAIRGSVQPYFPAPIAGRAVFDFHRSVAIRHSPLSDVFVQLD
jgi:hypothetical protein